MKKAYEAPDLFKIRFDAEEHLMVSVIPPDDVDEESSKLPSVDIFG